MRFNSPARLIGNGFLIAGAIVAQTTGQQVLRFAHTQNKQNAQEIATAIRSVLDIRQVSVSNDDPPSTLTLGGTDEQLKAAGWMFTELDQAAPASSTQEYRLSGTPDNVVRIYYVTNAQTAQQFMELATAIRTIADVRRLFTCTAPKAIVLRASVEQMRLVDWLLPNMDKPLGAKSHQVSEQYAAPDARDQGVTQVFYAGYAPAVKDFQALATALRGIAQIRSVFTYNAAQAIALRGTASELAMAEWLFNQLDQPPQPAAAAAEYQAPGPDDVVRVFDLSHAKTGQELPNIVAQIRSSSKTQAALSYGSRSILVLRGTAAQMLAAEQLVVQLNQP